MLLHTSYLTQYASQPIKDPGTGLPRLLRMPWTYSRASRTRWWDRSRAAHDQVTTYCLTLLYKRWSEGDVLCYKRNRYRPQVAVRFRTLPVRTPCPPPPQ